MVIFIERPVLKHRKYLNNGNDPVSLCRKNEVIRAFQRHLASCRCRWVRVSFSMNSALQNMKFKSCNDNYLYDHIQNQSTHTLPLHFNQTFNLYGIYIYIYIYTCIFKKSNILYSDHHTYIHTYIYIHHGRHNPRKNCRIRGRNVTYPYVILWEPHAVWCFHPVRCKYESIGVPFSDSFVLCMHSFFFEKS